MPSKSFRIKVSRAAQSNGLPNPANFHNHKPLNPSNDFHVCESTRSRAPTVPTCYHMFPVAWAPAFGLRGKLLLDFPFRRLFPHLQCSEAKWVLSSDEQIEHVLLSCIDLRHVSSFLPSFARHLQHRGIVGHLGAWWSCKRISRELLNIYIILYQFCTKKQIYFLVIIWSCFCFSGGFGGLRMWHFLRCLHSTLPRFSVCQTADGHATMRDLRHHNEEAPREDNFDPAKGNYWGRLEAMQVLGLSFQQWDGRTVGQIWNAEALGERIRSGCWELQRHTWLRLLMAELLWSWKRMLWCLAMLGWINRKCWFLSTKVAWEVYPRMVTFADDVEHVEDALAEAWHT